MRDYWAIENSLHYRRDKTLREDATRMSNSVQAQVMASLKQPGRRHCHATGI